MMKKKLASLLVAGALITTMGTLSAFAATPAADLPLCTVSGCTTTGNHRHNGTSYAGHYTNDGHAYHANCTVSGCYKTGTHTTHTGGHNNHNSHRGTGGHH